MESRPRDLNLKRKSLIQAPAEIVSVSNPHESKILSLSKQIWGGIESPEATSEICLKEMAKFHEQNVGLEEKVVQERLKMMKKKNREMYVMKLREIKKLELKVNLKIAEIVLFFDEN
ncbi:hypothetical protein Pint_30691 [Pistacia integerrima]|uniref:Uncharacterized protein n=1 Tax=Pistacia integerrima TaxID=434235 RepID=A0ACC0WY69_9ROSI|nr:hypothetical protein Pint_30691 [Pistacia integerrima]